MRRWERLREGRGETKEGGRKGRTPCPSAPLSPVKTIPPDALLALLDAHEVLVATPPGDASTLLGWCCYSSSSSERHLIGCGVRLTLAGPEGDRDWAPVVELVRELLAPLLVPGPPVGVVLESPMLAWQELQCAGWMRPTGWYQDDAYLLRCPIA
jgi:hypothetical protein